MPTYGYRCTACGHEFERFQKISDPALTDCESCGGAIKKMIYPVGIQFKGSGFYVNDYAKKSSGSSSESGGSGSGAAAPASSSTDSAGTPSTPTPTPAAPPAPATSGSGSTPSSSSSSS